MINHPERHFGRIAAHDLGDDRDVLYSMRLALPPPVRLPEYRYWPNVWGPLDQGATSTCVPHALKHWMLPAPVVQTRPDRQPFPYDVYRDLVLIDEWPDNDGGALPGQSLNFGTSVRAAFKWAQHAGYVSEYRWAQNMADLSEWLLTKGPVVIGCGWFEDMMAPNVNGFIDPTGTFKGGHAACIVGHNARRGDYTILNSWGSSWGRNGRARISGSDLERLIFEQGGEAVAGLEVRR